VEHDHKMVNPAFALSKCFMPHSQVEIHGRLVMLSELADAKSRSWFTEHEARDVE